MENENKLVALSQKNLLAKVNSRIGITNKLIAENNKKLVVEIFEKNPKFFLGLISRFYLLTIELLRFEKILDGKLISRSRNLTNLLVNTKISDIDKITSLDWSELSINSNIIWTEKIIDSFIEKWDWSLLCSNSNICWNEEMIIKYKSKINWESLSTNRGILYDEYLIEKYCDQLSFKELSSNWSVKWNARIIEKYQDKWDWARLSRQLKIPWCGILLEKYKEKLNWESISFWTETKLTEDIISKYENNWDWTYLSWRFNGWNDNLIRRFKPKIIWNGYNSISRNEIAWSMEMIEKYENDWDWDWASLSSNKKVVWNEYYLNHFEHKLHFSRLSTNESIVWNIELLEKYQSKWDWKMLSRNKTIPWSIDLIEKYQEKWDYYALIHNTSVPTTIQFLYRHSLKLTSSNHLWKKLEPYIDDELVIKLLEDIKSGKIEINN